MTEQLKTIPLPTRNALYAVNLLPGVDTTGTVRDVVDQRAPGTDDQHHARRREREQQPGQGGRRLLRDGAPAARRDRTGDAHDRGAGRRERRPGGGADPVRHPLGHEQLPRHLLRLHAAPGAQHQLVDQREEQPRQEPHHPAPGGRERSAGRSTFPSSSTAAARRSSSSTTKSSTSRRKPRGRGRSSTPTRRRDSIRTWSAGQPRTVNIMQVAAATGNTATFDPMVRRLINDARAAALTTGTISVQPNELNRETYIYQSPGKGVEHLPTTRLDFNLSARHRLSGTYYWQEINRFPDIQNTGDSTYPGFPAFNNYLSHRTVGSIALRSTLTPSLVHELTGGWQWSPNYFSANMEPALFQNQGGFQLGIPQFSGDSTQMTGFAPGTGGERPRNNPIWNIDSNLNWQRGTHSFAFGGSFTQVGYVRTLITGAPTVNFGIQTGLDPADAMFNTTNFPDASNNNLTDMRALYAFLTGRVTTINGTARLNPDSKYVYIGPTTDDMRLTEFGAYAQDSWRVTPALTLNAGVRWELQLPIEALNANYSTATMADICGPSGAGAGPGGRTCNLFHPGIFNAPGPGAAVHAVRRQHGRLQDRLEQLRAERERRLAAQRAVGLAALDPRRSRAGDAARRLRRGVHPQRHGRVREHLRRQPGPSPSRRTGTTRSATSSGRRVVAAALPRDAPPRPAAALHRAGTTGRLHSRGAGLPDARHHRDQREHLRSGDPALVHQLVHGRLPARAVARTWRSKSATSAPRTAMAGRRRTGTRSTSTRTASSTSSSWRRPTCARMSPPAAARRARPRAASRTAGPTPARRRCRSTWRTSTRRTQPMPATPRSTPARTGRTRRSSAG